MTAPVATRRQLNAIGAFLVQQGVGDPEKAGDLAHEMLEACGYDVSKLQTETVDRQKPFLYTNGQHRTEDL